jgi:hypothetical protein
MAVLYSQIESGIWKNENDFTPCPAYSNSVDIFPQISRLVYKRMTARDTKPESKPVALSNLPDVN